MKTALLIIDIQNDYFPEGKNELEGAVEAARNAGLILSAFRKKSLPVFHVQHLSVRPGATFFIPGTPGADIHELVRPLANELVFTKHYPNSFRETELLGEMKVAGVGELVICGMMTHMCIDATARAAFDFMFKCTVVSDACATKALTINDTTVAAEHVHNAFLAALGSVYARISRTDEVIGKL